MCGLWRSCRSTLHIAGFKSFPDRAELGFDDGVTAIVGPNGCGKSNVVDAITWVLGEQSAKSLRGERMEDVIFSGSEARKPTDTAEVRLKFTQVRQAMAALQGLAEAADADQRYVVRYPKTERLGQFEVNVLGHGIEAREDHRRHFRPRKKGLKTLDQFALFHLRR